MASSSRVKNPFPGTLPLSGSTASPLRARGATWHPARSKESRLLRLSRDPESTSRPQTFPRGPHTLEQRPHFDPSNGPLKQGLSLWQQGAPSLRPYITHKLLNYLHFYGMNWRKPVDRFEAQNGSKTGAVAALNQGVLPSCAAESLFWGVSAMEHRPDVALVRYRRAVREAKSAVTPFERVSRAPRKANVKFSMCTGQAVRAAPARPGSQTSSPAELWP
jgi:hypothetical protein